MDEIFVKKDFKLNEKLIHFLNNEWIFFAMDEKLKLYK